MNETCSVNETNIIFVQGNMMSLVHFDSMFDKFGEKKQQIK